MDGPFSRSRVTVPDRVIARRVEDITVLLDVETGHTYTLDDVGSRAWTVLTSASSIEDAYERLLAEFTVEPERLKSDLETLIADLNERRLVTLDPVR